MKRSTRILLGDIVTMAQHAAVLVAPFVAVGFVALVAVVVIW